MKRILLISIALILFGCGISYAQTGVIPVYFCGNPGVKAVTSGASSSNFLEGVIPTCTVTIYLTGTVTKATIYADASNTPRSNPFTANTNGSIQPTWAATGQAYDVVLSGGIPPNTYASSVTLTGLGTGAGSGGGGSGTVTSVGLVLPSNIFNVTVSPITTSGNLTAVFQTQTSGAFFAGPCSGTAVAPTFRGICYTDMPVFVASGSGHEPGAVPDPGATAGTTRFLREDATWVTPTFGGTCPAITPSATPVFDFTSSSCRAITLGTAITSSTSTGYVPGVLYQVVLIENGTGGYTAVMPVNFKGGPTTINLAANGKTVCNYLSFTDNNFYLQGSCQWF